jgi:hypothetical protein
MRKKSKKNPWNPWASPAAQSHLRVPWPPAADAAPAPRSSRGWPRPLQSAPGAGGSARMGRFLMGDFYHFDEFFMGMSIILCVFIRDFTDFYSFMIF